jgi:hypothetical protein
MLKNYFPLLETIVLILASALCLITAPVFGQSPVIVTLDPKDAGAAISPDFVGLSFEMQRVLPGTNGFHLFSPSNKRLIATFKTLGIKSLRVGGNTADRPNLPLPTEADVDSLFAFAKAAKVKVIYTLRLREEDVAATSAMARYISRHYQPLLECFAIGNEPNVFSTNYETYVAGWKRYAATVTAPTNAPEARFCGPSVSPGHETWSRDFANEFGRIGLLAFISQHDYPGGDGRNVKDPAAARARILSAAMDEHYSKFADVFVPAIASNGLPYRLEEANSFYDGGALDVSDTFAAALWGLNYLWWWAAHGASGINFHTGDKVAARDDNAPCKYAVFWTSPKGYNIHPLGYALKMFSAGSRGTLLPAAIANPDNLNLSVFCTRADEKTIYATLINKENGSSARDANITLIPGFARAGGQVMFLAAPDADISLKTGVTLGGAEIADDAGWKGKWTSLSKPSKDGKFSVKLPAATAAIVKLKVR